MPFSLRDAVLLLRQLVTNGLRRGFLIVARVDAQFGEEFYLCPWNVAIAVWVLFKIVLMILLSGVVVFRGRSPRKFFTAVPLDLRDALHRLSGASVGVVHAGLVLAAPVVALPVLYRGSMT